jgi:hypothetical protein
VPGQATEDEAAAGPTVTVNPEDIPDVSKYPELSNSYKNLKWRVISRPGGATMKPTDFYRMEGTHVDTQPRKLAMSATKSFALCHDGPHTTEREK